MLQTVCLSKATHPFTFTVSDFLKIVDHVLTGLSLVLLLLLVWDTFVDQRFLFIYDMLYTFLWIIFTLEFGTRFLRAKHKVSYLGKRFFTVFIILFPFLRPLQLFPFSRFWIIIFANQANATFPLFRKYRILEILLVSIILVILSADMFMIFERTPDTLFKNFGDALWFSVVTVATVGYGDVFPRTTAGRVLASFLIVFGVSIFGIVTATISSILVERDMKDDHRKSSKELDTVQEEDLRIESKLDLLLEKEEIFSRRLGALERSLKKQ